MADSWKDNLSPQHMAIMAVAGVMIFISTIDAITSDSPDISKSGDAAIKRSLQGPRYRNPRLSMLEKIFCRGYQRSFNCGYTFYHPMRRKLEAKGIRIREQKAPDGVVRYRGRLDGDRDLLSGKIYLDHE